MNWAFFLITWCWHRSPWSSGVCSAESWGALLEETRCASSLIFSNLRRKTAFRLMRCNICANLYQTCRLKIKLFSSSVFIYQYIKSSFASWFVFYILLSSRRNDDRVFVSEIRTSHVYTSVSVSSFGRIENKNCTFSTRIRVVNIRLRKTSLHRRTKWIFLFKHANIKNKGTFVDNWCCLAHRSSGI